jgi:hypothetical protein
MGNIKATLTAWLVRLYILNDESKHRHRQYHGSPDALQQQSTDIIPSYIHKITTFSPGIFDFIRISRTFQ